MADFGIRVIFGMFGKGKGVTNTILATIEMNDSDIYLSSLLGIEELEEKKNRPFARPPQPHVVFSNYTIEYKGLRAYDFDPDKFMLPNSDYDFSIYPPFSCFHVEEGHSGSFLSYDWSKFPKPSLLAFSRVRHPKFLFNIDLQFITNLNKNMRKFAFEYITPLNLEHKYNCLNMLCETTVYIGVFYNYEKAVEFETTQDINLVEELRIYVFKGNIYDCFDSYSKKDEFYDVDNDKDFVYEIEKIKNIGTDKKVVIEL